MALLICKHLWNMKKLKATELLINASLALAIILIHCVLSLGFNRLTACEHHLLFSFQSHSQE